MNGKPPARDGIVHDEILEILYMKEEEGTDLSEKDLLAAYHYGHTFESGHVEELVRRGLVERVQGGLALTSPGREQARRLIRCHRLAERLLVDVLTVRDEIVESSACRFEHFLSDEVADSICTLLGHPSFCPHQRPIPPGECCRHAEKEAPPILKPMSQLQAGEEGEVAYISSPFHERLSRLASLGLSPGARLKIRQVKPAFIVQVGESEVALEEQVAREIYLRVAGNSQRRR